MPSERLKSLKKFLEETPNDPFLIYAIALEYEKENKETCLEYYNQLLNDFPDYLATYYSLGKYYENKEDYDKAEEIFLAGLDLAKKQGETKTAGELQTAIDLL